MWDSDAVYAALGVVGVSGGWCATGVSIDSRTVSEGDIFVALRGDNFDGHDYIGSALDKGAVAVIGERNDRGENFLRVDNSLQALQLLGQFSRRRLSGAVIGITGSVGKTTTKEMLVHALAGVGRCYGSHGNLNNEIGLPLALANCPHDADFGVFELGMNHFGEIAFLTALLSPDLAMITNIRAAHMMSFANLSEVAQAKSEIFVSSPRQALIFNESDAVSDFLQAAAARAGVSDIRTFSGVGGTAASDYRLLSCSNKADKNYVAANLRGRRIEYNLAALGAHAALNSVAVMGCLDMILGESFGDILKQKSVLSDFAAPGGRGQLSRIVLRDGGEAWLIDDSYNASPAAVSAGLRLLAQLRRDKKAKRSIAILGDMLELGDKEGDYHAALLPQMVELGIDKFMAVGERMGDYVYEKSPDSLRLGFFENSRRLGESIYDILASGDIILLKGSHSIGLQSIAAQLKGNRLKGE